MKWNNIFKWHFGNVLRVFSLLFLLCLFEVNPKKYFIALGFATVNFVHFIRTFDYQDIVYNRMHDFWVLNVGAIFLTYYILEKCIKFRHWLNCLTYFAQGEMIFSFVLIWKLIEFCYIVSQNILYFQIYV